MNDESTAKLEKYRLMVLKHLSKEFIEDAKFEFSDSTLFGNDGVCIRIIQEVWGQKIGEEVRIEYPADWWQAFKERWFAGWMLKRWPVRYSETVLQLAELYPKWKPNTESVISAVKFSPGRADTKGIEYLY